MRTVRSSRTIGWASARESWSSILTAHQRDVRGGLALDRYRNARQPFAVWRKESHAPRPAATQRRARCQASDGMLCVGCAPRPEVRSGSLTSLFRGGPAFRRACRGKAVALTMPSCRCTTILRGGSEGRQSAPFLFVGSGVARRYLNTDRWVDLQRMAAFTDRPYAYYDEGEQPPSPRVATEIAVPFHDVWFTNDRFGRRAPSSARASRALRAHQGRSCPICAPHGGVSARRTLW